MAVDVAQVIKRHKQLKTERQPWDSYWQEISKYCLPRKAYVTRERTPGTRLPSDVYDSTAMDAVNILAGGLHSYLTNPASKWFSIRTQDKSLMENKDNKIFLKNAEDKIYDTLNSSNFSQQIHELYLDLGVFGTAGLFEEEDPKDIVRFYCRPIRELSIAEDSKERIDTVYREFKLSARQAEQEWGKNAGDVVANAIKNKEYEKKIVFLHAIFPRYERDTSKDDAINMPYASVYIEISKKHLISESGYEEFPFFGPRWNKESGEVWGTSAAMIAHSDTKQLNTMSQTVTRSAQKKVDPPLMFPHDGYLLPIRLGPAAVNFKLRGTHEDKIEELGKGGDIPIGLEMENQRRGAIKRMLFVDLFLLLAEKTPEMTATEVMKRVEEKMLILAPTLGRLMSELLDPIITRTFNILLRNRLLGKVPKGLENVDYVIEYISPLAKAQRLEEMKSLRNMLELIGTVGAHIPAIIDKIDGDKLVDMAADIYNISPNLIRDMEEVKKIREQRAQNEQIYQVLEQLKQGADIGEVLSNIKTKTQEKK